MSYIKIKKFLLFLIISLFFICALPSFAAEILTQPSTQTTVVAPEGLTSKEKADLERQYRFDYRNKGILQTPYVSMPGGGAAEGIEAAGLTPINEEEVLYRYFGIATELYKSGKAEEASEVLKFILLKKPGDEYVKSYLKKITEESKKSTAKWEKITISDAKSLKEKEIKDLLRDGIDYYENKDFDAALVKFNDALSLDPQNKTAKTYLDKLKSFYLLKTRVEDIVMARESGESAQAIKPELREAGEKLLAQTAPQGFKGDEFKQLILDKKAQSLLEQNELNTLVQEIIQQQREAERRSNSFILGPGDILQISVRNHPELSGPVTVNLSGGVPLPLTGDVVMARGLTIEELNEQVKKVVEKYVKDPKVAVTLTDYRSKIFYVVDEIGATPYPISRPNFTLRDALLLSDWGNDRALGRVLIVKASKLHPVIKKVDTFDIIYRGNLRNNIRIENGDVIYIPQTIVGKSNKVILDTFAPLSSLASGTNAGNEMIRTIRRYKGQNMQPIREDDTTGDNN